MSVTISIEDFTKLAKQHNETVAKLAAYERVVEAAKAWGEWMAFGQPALIEAMNPSGALLRALDALTGKDASK